MSYFVSRLTKGFRLCLLFEYDHDRGLIPMGLSGWDGQEDLNRLISTDQPIDIRHGDFRRGSSNLESRERVP